MLIASTSSGVMAKVVIELCIFEGNEGSEGGAIYIDGMVAAQSASLVLRGASFKDNVGSPKDLQVTSSAQPADLTDACPSGYEGETEAGASLGVSGPVANNDYKNSYGKGGCQRCLGGTYLNEAAKHCDSCTFGKYSSAVRATDPATCVPCEEGKTTVNLKSETSLACVSSTHEFNFMGCTDGFPVVDSSSSIEATAMNGAKCSAEGIVLDGFDDYVDIEPWEFGGATTFEVYVKYDIVTDNTMVFDFSEFGTPNSEFAARQNSVTLGNPGFTDSIRFTVDRSDTGKSMWTDSTSTATFKTKSFTHIVVTVEGGEGILYKNGPSFSPNSMFLAKRASTDEPLVATRSVHWLGRNSWTPPGAPPDDESAEDRSGQIVTYLKGTIAYLKVWHNKALTPAEIEKLPTIPCVPGLYGAGYPDCLPCPVGTYGSESGMSVCSECPEGMTSFVVGAISADSCTAGVHEFNFRNCENNVPVLSAGNIAARAKGGAACSPEGLYLDGIDSYVEMDPYEWGGKITYEVYVRLGAVESASESTIFEFQDIVWGENVALRNIKGKIDWTFRDGNSWYDLESASTWDADEWVHVVVTVDHEDDNKMIIYKNKAPVAERPTINKPKVFLRDQNFLGRSYNFGDRQYLEGTIAYFRVWHNKALTALEVENLEMLACAPGSFGPSMTNCTICPAGSYTEDWGAQACSACPPGSFLADDGGFALLHNTQNDCTPCPSGTFNSDASPDFGKHDSGSCVSCEQGKYNSDEGTAASLHLECTRCPTGRYNEDSTDDVLKHNSEDDCVPCIAGRYADVTGSKTCTDCPPNTSSSPGASACGSCPAGYTCPEDGLAQACPEGFYTDGTQPSCIPCNVGYRCPGGMNQQVCSPGSYQNLPEQAVCLDCEAGTFQRLAGNGTCELCEPGHFCPKRSSAPINCGSIGLWCDEGSTSPTGVSSGFYTTPVSDETVLLRSGEKICEVGSVCTSGSRMSCSGVGYSDENGLVSCKSAPAGYRVEDDNESIIKCAAGKYSSGGSMSCIDCPVGKYASGQGSVFCSSASICPPGQRVTVASTASTDTVCGNCEVGKASRGGAETTCVRCKGEGTYADAEGLSACKTAPAGTEVTSDRTNITQCSAGFYSTGGKTSCLSCGDGTYSGKGAVACTPSNPGYYPTDDHTSTIKCSVGKYSAGGLQECLDCASGTFTGSEGSVFCSSAGLCGPGKKVVRVNSATDDTVCGACDVGTASLGGAGSTCPQCSGEGEYADVKGLSSCKSAPPGHEVNLNRTNVTECSAGFYSSGGLSECIACSSGEFSSARASVCQTCRAGEYVNGASCLTCPAGTYAESGAAECTECAEGYVAHEEGSAFCVACKEGKYTALDGRSCLDCEPGKISGVAAKECSDCDKGKFVAGYGKSFCTYCNSKDGLKGSTTTAAGSQGLDDCVCTEGEMEYQGSCEPVFVGVSQETPGMDVVNMTLLQGYWRTDVNSTSIELCLSEHHCLGGRDPKRQCADGHTGPLCAVCSEGYASRGSGVGLKCVACGDGTTSIIVTYFSLFAFVIMLGMVASCFCRKRSKEREENEDDDAEAGNRSGSSGFTKKMSSIGHASRIEKLANKAENIIETLQESKPILKMCLSYLQISSGLSFAFDLQFPDMFTSLMNFVGNVVNLDFLSLMPLGCVMPSNFYSTLVIYTAVPAILGLVMVLLYFRWRASGEIGKANTVFSWFLFMTFLVLPSVSTKIFTTFACKTFASDYGVYLKADYSIDCNSTQHVVYMLYAAACVVIYPVGIPVMYYKLLHKQRAMLDPGQDSMSKEEGSQEDGLKKALERRSELEDEHPAVMALSFLYSNYKPNRYYFEVVETGRKLMLTGGLLVLGPGTTSQIVISLIISINFLRFSSEYKPFIKFHHELFNELSQWQLFYTLLAALMIKIETDAAEMGKWDVLVVGLQAVGPVVFVLVIVLKGRKLLLKARDKRRRKKEGKRGGEGEEEEVEEDGGGGGGDFEMKSNPMLERTPTPEKFDDKRLRKGNVHDPKNKRFSGVDIPPPPP
jgi:hypothetical protein